MCTACRRMWVVQQQRSRLDLERLIEGRTGKAHVTNSQEHDKLLEKVHLRLTLVPLA